VPVPREDWLWYPALFVFDEAVPVVSGLSSGEELLGARPQPMPEVLYGCAGGAAVQLLPEFYLPPKLMDTAVSTEVTFGGAVFRF
jgi:hypothetical protein